VTAIAVALMKVVVRGLVVLRTNAVIMGSAMTLQVAVGRTLETSHIAMLTGTVGVIR